MTLYFAHISDTHILSAQGATLFDADPAARAEQLVHTLNNFNVPLDFVLHTGDVVDDADDDSAYRRAAAIFAQLNMPVYFATGNHDRSAKLRTHLAFGPREEVDSQRLDYLFTIKGEQFAVLDGRAPDELDPHGILHDAQLDWLQRLLNEDGPPLTVCLHYAPLAVNTPWIDARMLLLNGTALHDTLSQARRPLRAVLHGHLHRPIQIRRDRLLYVCAPSPFAGFSAYPDDIQMHLDSSVPLGYNYVQYLPHQIVIMQQQLGAAAEQ